jgi:hypothetical protein
MPAWNTYLARSECREGTWHVVTYDVTNPNKWIEVDDIDTKQPCTEPVSTIAVSRLTEREAIALGLRKRKKSAARKKGRNPTKG